MSTDVQVPEETIVDTAAPTEQESMDARIEQALKPMKNIKPDPLDEADKAAIPEGDDEESEDEAGEEDVKPTAIPAQQEKPAESQPEETPVSETQEQPQKESRIDRRLAAKYIENQLLQGVTDVPSVEAVIAEIRGVSLDQKKEALKNQLYTNKVLRNGGVDDGRDPVLTDEDREALIDAEVEQRLQGIQEEVRQREWNEDLVRTVDAHPELKTKSKLTDSVERLVDRGMKASEAYDFVMGTINEAKAEAEKATKKAAEIKKQKALSGAVSTGSALGEETSEMTSEEIKQLRTKNPREYNRLVKAGQI